MCRLNIKSEEAERLARELAGATGESLAGAVSGLLGIGSGVLKMPSMDLAMHLPIKVSTATSNFIIGVTTAASAGVSFARGDTQPFVAAPVTHSCPLRSPGPC